MRGGGGRLGNGGCAADWSTHLHTDTHIHAHIRSLLGLVRAFPLYCSHMGRLAFLWYLIAGHVLLTSGLLWIPLYYCLFYIASLQPQKIRERAGTFPGSHGQVPPSAHTHCVTHTYGHTWLQSHRDKTVTHRDSDSHVTGFDTHPGKSPAEAITQPHCPLSHSSTQADPA